MPSTAVIWVVNEAGHPTHKANDLLPGLEIKPLTIRENSNPLRLDRLNFHLAEGIGRYAKAEDYLLISGTPMINAMAVLLWILRFGEAKVIQWNAAQHKRCYQLNTIAEADLRELLERFVVPDAA